MSEPSDHPKDEESEGRLRAIEDVSHAVEKAIERLDAREKTELARQKAEEAVREQLTSRVSIAAIGLTFLLSFVGFARAERDSTKVSLKIDADNARVDAQASWTLYQTKSAERSSYLQSIGALERDVQSLAGDDPRAALARVQFAEYTRKVDDIDDEGREVFWSVQGLERSAIRLQRQVDALTTKVAWYDISIRVLTLSVVLLSATLLAKREYLFWIGIGLATIGAAIAFNAYFRFF